jgi:hypothetical protein
MMPNKLCCKAHLMESMALFFCSRMINHKTKTMANKNRNRDNQQDRQSDIGNRQQTTQTGGQNQGGQRSNMSENKNQGNNQSRQGEGGNRGSRGNRGLG